MASHWFSVLELVHPKKGQNTQFCLWIPCSSKFHYSRVTPSWLLFGGPVFNLAQEANYNSDILFTVCGEQIQIQSMKGTNLGQLMWTQITSFICLHTPISITQIGGINEPISCTFDFYVGLL